MFLENSLDQDFNLGAGAFTRSPIDGYAFADLGDELDGDDL